MSGLSDREAKVLPLLAGARAGGLVCSPGWSRVLAGCLSSQDAQNGLGAYAPLLEGLARPSFIDRDASRLVDEAADV